MCFFQVRLDQSNQQVSFVLRRAFRDGYQSFFEGMLKDCEFPKETADLPLVFGDPVYGPEVRKDYSTLIHSCSDISFFKVKRPYSI